MHKTTEVLKDITAKANDEFGYVYSASFAHSAVHRDVIIQAQDYVASATTRDILIKIPADVNPHLVYSVNCSEGARVQFYEGATITGDGTTVLTARLNRNSGKTTQTEIYHTPNISDIGTELPGGFLPGGSGGNAQGGSVALHTDAEWLLKADTNYIIRVTASSSTISTKLEWYE